MNDRCTILLDTENRHPCIECRLGHRVQHFTDRIECIQYIQNQLSNCPQIYLFLSSQNIDLIGNQLVLFQRVYFHVYHPTSNDIPNNNNYPRMWIQRFEEADLWVKISYTVCRHNIASYLQNNRSRATGEILRRTIEILKEEAREAKLGIQAND
ncbi:hypothetical protein I4U23_015655 [Adineta vaga]|nr:hypothetical protein I4U23_015655 [Adineta vaga]